MGGGGFNASNSSAASSSIGDTSFAGSANFGDFNYTSGIKPEILIGLGIAGALALFFMMKK